ncbi:modification methylase [candidate division TA06 bacterium SM23_40]|uniref:Methyltransferase n=1 Tax=candidate division TA06 bacterium SM23_40 TaxID=1703774 RepID=A0A0S8GCQ4_UNCT6|nr:MAG: modification methylase [candidate division TA06 bacterium SM23_40]
MRKKTVIGGDHVRATFYCEDCIAGMRRRLEPGSIDVIVTSPPYNLGTRYSTYDDTISRQDYLDWTRQWIEAAKGVLADDGSLFLNIGAKPSDPWVPLEVVSAIRDLLKLQNVIHWIKSIHIPQADVGRYGILSDDLTVGHYKPINSPRYLNDCHEYVFHITKHGNVKLDRLAIGVPYQDKSNISRWKRAGDGLHCRGNTWFIPYETIKNRTKERPHPASFPPALAEMCIRLHGLDRTKLVLDPFLGIGNTAVSALGLGIPAVVFEIDREYLSEATARAKAVVEAQEGRGSGRK